MSNINYMNAKNHIELVGKRARIIRDKGYCHFVYNKKGTIFSMHNWLYLQFDSPARREQGDIMPMSGVFLCEKTFKIIN